MSAAPNAFNTTVYFVDATLPDLATLLAGLPAGAEVHLIEAGQDGVQLLADTLHGRTGIEAVHLLTHGSAGSLNLGSAILTSANLENYSTQWAAVQASLADSADLLIYGCNVAEGEAGATFVSQLASLTGADVAASTDLTGAASLGGDWVLEAATGSIESESVEILAMQSVMGTDSSLPAGLTSSPYTWGGITFQTKYDGSIDDGDPENPLKSGNLWDRYVLNGVANGTVVHVYMGNSSTVDDYIQIGRNGSIVTQDDDRGDGERSYDAYVSWTYQAGDVIHATTFSGGYRGSYSLWISTGSAPPPVITDIGNNPVPTPTAPTFTDSNSALGTITDTSALDTSFSGFTGTLTASDTTPTGTLSFSGGGTQTYGTLSVASGGGFTFTPNATNINTLAAGATASHTYSVTVSDGSLPTSKNLVVNFTGVNDLPTLTGNAIMPGILEDAGNTKTTNAGTTVSALFGSRFSDVDTGATFKGVSVTANAAVVGEGVWEYSTDGGTNWSAITAGTTLLADYKVHFVPAANWSGTPGGLTVKAIDNNDGQSVGTATLAITVAAVNDLPTFTSLAGTYTTGTGSYADTVGNDTVFTPTTGKLTASDVDNTLANAFSIRGATLATDTWTAQGLYGTLTLHRSTGDWSYAPNKLATINALPADKTVHDVFDFKVTDPAGGASTQALDITITGTNDTPVVASAIVDQAFSGAGSWTYQIPAATFTDAEGAGLTYTVEVVPNADGTGAATDTIGAATSTGSASTWLTFNEATRTFSGDPSVATGSIHLKVTATDPSGGVVSDTFTLTLTDTANQPPVVANPLTWHAETAATEVTEVQFGGALGGQTVSFTSPGTASTTTVTVGTAQTDAEVASSVVAAGATTNFNVAIKAGSPNTVVYTAKVVGNVDDANYGNVIGAGTYNGTAISNKTTEGSGGSPESFTVTFGSNGASASTIVFNGLTVDIAANTVGTGVANLIANAPSGFTDWTVAQVGGNTNQVTFTRKIPGNVPDVVLATDFTGSFNYTGTTMGTIAQGTGYETFEVQYTGGYSGSTLIFDGKTVTAGSALTGEQVANAVLGGSYTGYTDAIKAGATDTVVFTATTSGDKTNIQVSDFGGTNAASKSININPQGGGWSYTLPANTFTDPENDTLTYTAWTVTGGVATEITTTTGDHAINFDPTTRAFSGNGMALPSHIIEVRATDAAGSNTTVSTQFGLYVDDGADGNVTAGTAIAEQTWTGAGLKTFQIPADAFVFDDATPDTLLFSATLANDSALPSWLSLDAATGKLSGNPPFGTTTPLSIKVTATEMQGGTVSASTATNTFTLNIATPNDTPVLTAPLADQLVTEGNDWSVTFGANIFSDPDGSATGTASTSSVTYTATLADGSALPSWITYTAATNTFSGTPPGGVPYLNIKVTGTDAGTAFASSTFTLNLQDPNAANSTGALTANNVGVVAITGANAGTVNEGQTLTAVRPTDADGLAGGTTVNYQWQVSTNSGSTWTDIAGTRGQAQTLTPTNDEAGTGKQVRVQAFYTDNGGVAESPVSTAVSVANVDDPGKVANNDGDIGIVGGLSAGSVLTATISDSDGLTNVTPTYTWQRSDAGSATNFTNIEGAANSSAYTVKADDGDRYIRVLTSYTDNQGTTNTPQATTTGPIQRGAVPPVAVDDTATVTEASGVANATAGTNVVAGDNRNLLSNDTDLNATDTKRVTEVRLGVSEGSGAMATNDGSTYTLVGRYGTLTVKMGTSATGGGVYTYTVNQDNEEVNALATGATLTDEFNYQVSDSTDNTDYGVLRVTVTGANDAPTVSGLRETSTVIEDLAGFIRTDMILVDPDLGAGANFELKLAVTSGRLVVSNVAAATGLGVTIKGDDTGTLTLTGNMGTITGWLQGDVIKYIASPNVLGNSSATLTLSAKDQVAGSFNTLGTMTLNVSPTNDAPRLDLDANNSSSLVVPEGSAVLGTGDNFITTFRPRGEAVKVVDTDIDITDADSADTLTGATVAITAGDLDNEFGTIFETLTASGGNSYAGSLGTITVSGNGTKALTFTGAGTHADYEALLKTISYVNNNPNAYSGDRTITIMVTDAAQIGATLASNVTDAATLTLSAANANILNGMRILKNGVDTGQTVLGVSGASITASDILTLATTDTLTFASNGTASVSNLASFTASSANSAIAVGQKIYLAGVDTGQTVATVVDNSHFVASGPITGLTPTSALSFATTAAVSAAVNGVNSFTVETANTSIVNGLHIYKNGVDTGLSVSNVVGTTISASGNITLAATDVLSFQTTTTNNAPIAATTTVRVPWTSVVDMDGTLSASRDYTTTYTEGVDPIAVATSTASIDNQAINIKTFTVTLTNPLDGTDGASEELSISASMVATLATKGITATVAADKHSITLSATNTTVGATATNMQLGLRAIKYVNNDQNPSVTPRVISTYVLDVADETGVTATTTINIVPVNDAPVIGGDRAATVAEGGIYVFNDDDQLDLNSSDLDDAAASLIYRVVSVTTGDPLASAAAPANGTLFRDSNSNNEIDSGEAIALNGTFTQAEVSAGLIKYQHAGGDNTTDGFGFQLEDGLENGVTAPKNTFAFTVTAVNDAPTLTATSAAAAFSEATGTAVTLFSGAAASTGDTTGAAQTIKKLVLTVSGMADGASEKLKVNNVEIDLVAANTTLIGTGTVDGISYAISLSGSTATVTLTHAGLSTAQVVTLVNTLAYRNDSNAPSTNNRVVTLTQIQDTGGTDDNGVDTAALSIATTVTVTAQDTTPTLPTNTGATLQDGALVTIDIAKLSATDADTADTAVTYTLTQASTLGTLFRDANVSGAAEAGEALGLGSTFTQADLVGNLIKYRSNGTVGSDSFKFTVADATTTLPEATFGITVSAIAATPGVTGGGTSTPSTDGSTPLFPDVTVTPPAGETVKSITFNVTGAKDGSDEVLNINGQQIPLVAGTTVVTGTAPNTITYSVVGDGHGGLNVTVTDGAAPGFTGPETEALIEGVTLANNAVPPTAGTRSVTLTNVVNQNGDGTATTTDTPNIGSIINVNTAIEPFPTPDIPTPAAGTSIQTLTFGVTGVQDGANEVLKVNGQDIPLVPGTTTIDGIIYTVTVDGSGNATVTVTNPTVPGWSESDAETLLGNTTYVNNATPPAPGERSVTLNSVTPVDNTTSTPAAVPTPVTGQGTTVQPTPATGSSTPLSGETLPDVPVGSSVDSLTFTVNGVSPATGNPSETLTIGEHVVPLMPGTTTYGTSPNQVTYTVTVVNGVATVVATPETNYPEATAQSIVQGVTYTNTSTPATGPREVSLTTMGVENDTTNVVTPTSTPGIGGTLVLNNTNEPPVLTPFPSADVPTPTGGNSIQTLTFGVTGVQDGANEVLNVNGQNIPLVPGTTIINGITYTVTVAGGNATVTVTDPTVPGWSEGDAETLVRGVTYVNNATSPTPGERGLTLQSVTQVEADGDLVAPTNVTTVNATTAPAAGGGTSTPMSGDTLPDVADGSSVDTLTFQVTGVQDGAHEVLTFGTAPNITTVPLVPGTVASTSPAGNYVVTVDGSGTATVVFTPATNLTEAEAIALTQSTTYTNNAAPPSAGPRGVSLTSLTQETGDGSTPGTITDSTASNVGSTILLSNNSNTAPTVSGDRAFAVNEGATYTLTAADMAATDAQLAAGSLVFKVTDAPDTGALCRDSNGNGLVNVGEELAQNATFTQGELTAGTIKYRHNGTEPVADSFKFTVSDGQATTSESTVTVTVNQANDAPTLAATGLNPNFTESGGAVPLFNGVTAGTVEAGQTLDRLKFTVAGLRDATESVRVDGVAVALTHGANNTDSPTVNGFTYNVSVTGTTATVTLTHAGASTPDMTDGATTTEVQNLLAALAYNNVNDNPTNGIRTITLTEVKDSGGTTNGGIDTTALALASAVNVGGTNNAPTLPLTSTFDVLEDGSFTLGTTQILAADTDTPLSSLVYTLTTGPSHGTVYRDVNGNAQIDALETVAQGGTFTQAELTSGKVRYAHDGAEVDDSFAVSVSDGSASAIAPLTVTANRIAVNDAPVIGSLASDVLSYPALSGIKVVEQGADATVTDADSTDFNGGSLRVAITFNHSLAHDVLSIKNIGTAAGQIGVSGSNVTYGGALIGSFAGGSGANDLVISFNAAAATPAAVQALVRAIQFQNDEAAPLASRTISFTLDDGDGGVAQPVPVNVSIATNTQPSINNGAGFYIAENTTLITALTATDPNNRPVTFSISGSADASNEDAARFSVNASTGVLSFATAPDFEQPVDVGGNNIYKVVVRATNDQNAWSESALTVNVVNVQDESVPVAGDTAGPVFGFATVNGSTLTMTYTDASNLDATNVAPTSAFAVSGNTVTAVAVNGTAKTVTLTLGTAVVAGAAVTVAYTDPTTGNDAAALQDAAGNDAATLAATSVSNITPSAGGGGSGGSGGGGTTTPTTPTTPVGGTTTTTDAQGNTTVVNNGTTPAVVSTPTDGGTVTTTGSGPTTVSNPGPSVTLSNTGTGTLTTSGITDSTELTLTGSGNQVVDLSGVPAGETVVIRNDGTGTVSVSNLPDGVIVILEGVGPISTNDADGASQSIEDLAPALTGGARGDGNGDGVADALQSNVTSTPFLNTPTAQSFPGNAPAVYVSLVADSRHGVIDTTDTNSASLSNVRQLDRPADAPANVQMPLGLVAFTANVGSPSVTETFSLFVDASLTVNGYWKQNATGTWVNLASDTYGGQVVTDAGGKTRLDFQITDGGEFDADGVANGSIVDPGAAGYMPLSLVGYPPDLPNDGFWF